jgi:hypothetical protein
MPGFTITRGLGPGATPSSFVLQGFGPVVEETIRIIRGGRSEASRIIKDLIHTFKISAKLAMVNGKHVSVPIINNVSRNFLEETLIKISANTKNVMQRDVKDIKVIASHVVKKEKLLK